MISLLNKYANDKFIITRTLFILQNIINSVEDIRMKLHFDFNILKEILVCLEYFEINFLNP